MSTSATTLSSLRQLLAQRYPGGARAGGRELRTGLPAIDEVAGGLPCGALTEVVCAAPSCGSQLLLGEILGAARRERGRAALVDASDSFDPQSWPADRLLHLVWARCGSAALALQAADILARDANFLLVAVDLRRVAAGELQRTPASFWYRLQRAVEPTGVVLCVFTPRASVPSARLRLGLERAHDFSALAAPRAALGPALAPLFQRQRLTASA